MITREEAYSQTTAIVNAKNEKAEMSAKKFAGTILDDIVREAVAEGKYKATFRAFKNHDSFSIEHLQKCVNHFKIHYKGQDNYINIYTISWGMDD